MVENRHITKIIIVIVAAAVVLCLLAMAFADKLSDKLGGSGVSMAYESRLFDTDEIIHIDIEMDEEEWNKMLDNALAEEFVPCNVVINGTRINNVAIRPKGNTSLSSIEMDPDTNRYSFKLEFDHYVKGQTCFGLDKLILNNNYADATNMKEAIIYDMFRYLGADASLYNFAEIFVNGEYWGVYLALEAVEDSFLLRNFGTQDGEMYKPDSMNMGDRDDGDSDGGERPEGAFPAPGDSDGDSAGGEGDSPGGSAGGQGESQGDSGGDSREGEAGNVPADPAAPDEIQADPAEPVRLPEAAPEAETAAEAEAKAAEAGTETAAAEEETAENGAPAAGNGDPGESSGDSAGGESDPGSAPDMEGESAGGPGGFGGGPGGGGANLNYTDDDLDSYSTIWQGEVTSTSKADHRRVVTALKNISEGNDLETYMDVDNLLRYMAVHTFAVNSDSLSGGMAHNYYLYEYKGQLNMFPWDYNLSFGGMGGGMGGNGASEMINDAIDTPFNATRFFDKLLEDETYLEQYHAYLRQLVEEYVFGGRFDEVYQRIRSQIDPLVETDPTAFYTYEDYQAGTEMLYQTVKLRAESIEGQLDGIIPSTDDGQRQDASALVDASGIDIDTMGTFGMGGGNGPGGDSDGGPSRGEAAPEPNGSDQGTAAPEELQIAALPSNSESGQEAAEIAASVDGIDPGAQGSGNRPAPEFPGSRRASAGSGLNKNLITFAVCLGIAILGIAGVVLFARRRKK